MAPEEDPRSIGLILGGHFAHSKETRNRHPTPCVGTARRLDNPAICEPLLKSRELLKIFAAFHKTSKLIVGICEIPQTPISLVHVPQGGLL